MGISVNYKRNNRDVEQAYSAFSVGKYHDKRCSCYLALWRAVIEQIVKDLKRPLNTKCGGQKIIRDEVFYQREEAKDLVFGHNRAYFEELCSLAYINPEYIIRKLREDSSTNCAKAGKLQKYYPQNPK